MTPPAMTGMTANLFPRTTEFTVSGNTAHTAVSEWGPLASAVHNHHVICGGSSEPSTLNDQFFLLMSIETYLTNL